VPTVVVVGGVSAFVMVLGITWVDAVEVIVVKTVSVK
jgi:hypothetical protein